MDERTLVRAEHVDRAISALNALGPAAKPPALEHEPILRAVISQNLRGIAGLMAMSGVPTPVINNAIREMDRLVTFTATTLHSAYCGILEDIVPADPAAEVAYPPFHVIDYDERDEAAHRAGDDGDDADDDEAQGVPA